MNKKLLLWIVLLVTVIVPLTAQTVAVFAPFVSGLQGEVKNNLIRLSWVDSPDIKGPIYIYKSANPFDGSKPLEETGIRPVEIPYGVQNHVDEIENGGALNYFAVASDGTGKTYEIPISSINTISVQISSGAAPAPVAAKSPLSEAEKASGLSNGISNLNADAQRDKITVSFNEGNARNVALYRSIRPINQTQDLLGAVILQTKVSSPFTDYPIPGIPYYYAAVTEDDLVNGTVRIIPGQNATRTPVEASTQRGDPEKLRAVPLPQMSAQAIAPGKGVYNEKHPTELSPQAMSALGTMPTRPTQVLKTPRVFSRDLASPSGTGEDYVLSSLVKGSFASKKWELAREELSGFLALPRNPETKARARFYLGQSHYFLQQPREGLFEFLSIQDRYPAEASEWIKASLDMLKN